jgi:hypothetical protein
MTDNTHDPESRPDLTIETVTREASRADAAERERDEARAEKAAAWQAHAREWTRAEGLRAEVARLRARIRVEAEDVVRARVTRAHDEAWLAANGWETLTHEDGWLSFVAPDGPHVDVHLRDWSSAQAVGALARLTRRAGLDILDEMAAVPLEVAR